jgi:acetylornithine deacetylase/succinyl-diaminopimelate desuccinylase-like protein
MIGTRPVGRGVLAAVLWMIALGSGVPTAMAATTPVVSVPEGRGFDPSSIPAYGGDHAAVYRHIDAHLADHLAEVQRWIRQPSVSALDIGVTGMAELLAADLRALGFQEVEMVPSPGHPGVWGFYDAGAARTLVLYMMYDVQPVDPNDWRSPPFEAAIVDHPLGRALMGRGATNQKGPERALLNAIDAIRAVEGELPVNLMVLAEGEEELGSPNFPAIVARYADRLRTADGVVFAANGQAPSGNLSVALGVKGIVYFEMEATGARSGGPTNAEIHGSLKVIVDAPAWRLVQALASLTTVDGNTIAVPGYYDDIRPPTEEEAWVFNGRVAGWNADEPGLRESLGVQAWSDGLEGREAFARYTFGTTLNIDGIWGGYTDVGTKTILPHKATAKLDSRLVPGQTPERALERIRAHLDANGFEDIEIRRLGGYPPAQTSIESPLVRSALGVYRKFNITPGVSVRAAGSAPYYVFTDLGLPMVQAGLGHGSGAHAPNEYMIIEPAAGSTIAGLADVEKYYVDLLYALAVGE